MKRNAMIIALLDEYKRAFKDYKKVLSTISDSLFEKIMDPETKDKDCKSVKSITFHIVQSGYTYINYVNTITNIDWFEYEKSIKTVSESNLEIDKMLEFTEKSLNAIIEKTNKEIEQWKFETRWKVTYDFDQLMEHAIVHVLRHRRQIERMLNVSK